MSTTELTDLANRLEDSRVKAMVDADIKTLDDILSNELYYGHTSGYIDNKASFLEKIASKQYSYFSITKQIADVQAIGESGLVINGELTIEANASGEKKVFHAIYLAVWRMEGEVWRFLSLQAAFKK